MKLLRFFVPLVLGVPASVAAQQSPAASPPANPVTSVFRERILASHRNLAQAFDSIPARLYGYKPTAPQQTVGYIAQHLVSDNYFFCNHFGDMKAIRTTKDAQAPDSVRATWPKDTLVAQLKESFAFCARALEQLDDTKLADQITITFGGRSRIGTRASMPLGHALDMADHYSQIANYMRLNNMLPPTALPRPRPPGGN